MTFDWWIVSHEKCINVWRLLQAFFFFFFWGGGGGGGGMNLTIVLTHWGRVMHICVGKLTIIGSGNGLSPGRRQAIIWTNAGILLIGPLGTNFSEILIEIQTFSLRKIRLKMSSAKCCSFRPGLNVLIVMNHRLEAHATYTVAFRYYRTKIKKLKAYSQPKIYP